MIIPIALITLLDALFLPLKGLATSVFVVITGYGLWKVTPYKNWYLLSLVFITLATGFFVVGDGTLAETVVHKLADWSYLFLVIGTVQLVRPAMTKYEPYLSKLPHYLFIAATILTFGLLFFDKQAKAQVLTQLTFLFILIALVDYLTSLLGRNK